MIIEAALLIAHSLVKPPALKLSVERPVHHFYDRPAKIELGAALALDAYDNAQTCHALSNNGREDSLPTQSCAGVTLILTAQLAAQEGVAYLFHRTNHHKIERFVRFFSIEGNTQGILHSMAHSGTCPFTGCR